MHVVSRFVFLTHKNINIYKKWYECNMEFESFNVINDVLKKPLFYIVACQLFSYEFKNL